MNTAKDAPMTPQELAKAIAESGYTITDLAESLDVTRETVGRWVRGKYPIDGRTAVAIRAVLGIE